MKKPIGRKRCLDFQRAVVACLILISISGSEASAGRMFIPLDPTGLSLTAITVSSIDLSWTDNSSDEQGFTIERATNPGGPYGVVTTTGADTTTYQDTNLDDNTTYYYRVSAYDITGTSGYTTAFATTLLDVPADPDGLAGDATNTCQVDLSWNDNADSEQGYEVERSLQPATAFSVIATLGQDISTFTDTGTGNDTVYYYRVRAYNAAGYSSYTATVQVSVQVTLDGGVIGTDQVVCPAGDPELLTNEATPTGGSGNWSYQWQSRISPAVFTDITSATGLTYDPPGGIAETTEYQRVSTTECGSVPSNTVVVTVEDLEPPVITNCRTDTTILIERNETGYEMVFPDLVATDNCELLLQTWTMSGATVASSPVTGINQIGTMILNPGITLVTYHLEDVAANIALCSFYVTIDFKIPEVKRVTIPNTPMSIGDTVTATITVGHDGGSQYSLVSGNVGGYILYNPQPLFSRLNDTTYRADFEITEGGNSYEPQQVIPVNNLVISDGTDQSLPFNGFISQDNDPIDAAVPLITSMVAQPGIYKIGDAVVLTIIADGAGYDIDPLSAINGLLVTEPNIFFAEAGGGIYTLTYIVEAGNNDVGPDELVASVILVKPSGNVNLPYTLVENVSLVTIDANAPVVTRLEVPSVEVGVGGVVQITVTADGEGYSVGTGSVVNGVPITSPRVTYTEYPGGLYEVSYTVDILDASVAPGNLQASIIMVDSAGNFGDPYNLLEPNTLEVYTELPTAVLVGTPPVICEGEPAVLTVFLDGRPPWSVHLYDGSDTTKIEGVTDSELVITTYPIQNTTYRVTRVRDINGVENTGSGSPSITVNTKTDVAIINLAPAYSLETDPFLLQANVPGGTFSGPGVFSATGYFDPGLADTVNSPHTIVYTYVNSNGCISTDSAQVFILGARGDIDIPADIFCGNDDPFDVSAFNTAMVTGSFRLLNSTGQPVTGIVDHHDNTATITPAQLAQGTYTVEYRYVDMVVLYIRKTFEIEEVTEPIILNLNQASYCQNYTPFILQANIPDVMFEGPGVSGNISQGYLFTPQDAQPGEITITCTAFSQSGCIASVEKKVVIEFAPVVDFTLNTACIPDGGGSVSFNNLTSGKLLVESWEWDFGDPGSGNNTSNLVDPEHYYAVPGQRFITLTATTYNGCASTLQLDTIIGNLPLADFSWLSSCLTEGQPTKLYSNSVSGFYPLDTLIWRFRLEDGTLLGEKGTDAGTDTVLYGFNVANNYLVELEAINGAGCADTATRELLLRPIILLSADGYQEGFNLEQGSWTVQSDDQVESWVWDLPDFTGFTPVSGDRAWFTRLPVGAVDYLENSWVQSPCFDFTAMHEPVIGLDIMKSFVPDVGGAVLQYMDTVDEGWKTVGDLSGGINWYNSDHISNTPGGSSVGWSLEQFQPDTDWLSARNEIRMLAGNPGVTFRIAFASTGREGMGNQGFAFDNVFIAERSRKTILEHFTNSSEPSSRGADDLVDEFGEKYSREVIDLQYHVEYPGIDPMNQNNQLPPEVRRVFYGIPSIPYAVMDGGVNSEFWYDFSDFESSPNADHLGLLSLEDPVFEIDLTVDWFANSLEVNTTVRCVVESYNENVQLYLALLESSVTAYTGANGDTQFRNVVLDMLPNPAGELLGTGWQQGMTASRSYQMDYPEYVEDVEDLVMVAFVQSRPPVSSQILQAEVQYKEPQVGIVRHRPPLEELKLYPNPTTGWFYLRPGTQSVREGRIELTDLSGRVVMMEEVPPGYEVYRFDLEGLPRGIYIVQWYEAGQLTGRGKVVRTD